MLIQYWIKKKKIPFNTMVYMNQHDIKLFTENVCILRNSSKFLRPLSLSMCILQDIKNRYFMHLNIYQSPSGVRVHESISTWFYLEMVDSWDEIFWWEPLPWDHTREISNTNSCINDINELLFYKKKKLCLNPYITIPFP